MSERLTAAALAKASGRQPESVVLDQVRDLLRLRGWLVFRHQQSLGSLKGFPDLTALKDGVTIYVECKTATGKLSQHQENIRRDVEWHGGCYVVARGIDDLEEL
jgi:Holliday junction resolvase